MAKPILLSYNKYAQHRGCSLSTVQRAIKDERILEAVIESEGKKLINRKLADKLWIQNTDPRRANNYKGAAHADELYNADLDSNNKEEEVVDLKSKNLDFQRNRALREAYTVRMAKLNFEKQAGQLVEVKKVKEYMMKIHTRARDSLLNLPDKLGPKLAAETDIHKIINTLNEEIQIVCNHFSKGEIDF